MRTLGQEIKKARIDFHLQQKDLQALTGISQKYLSRIENDKADPGWQVVRRLAGVLGLELTELLEGPALHHCPLCEANCQCQSDWHCRHACRKGAERHDA